MKNNTTLLLLVFSAMIMLGSCSVSNMNKQLILGRWEVVKTGPFIQKNTAAESLQAGDSLTALALNPDVQAEMERQGMTNYKNIARDTKKKQRQVMRASLFSSVVFDADQTATLYFGKKGFPAQWKMNRRGNKIMMRDTASSIKATLTVVLLDSLNLKTINKFPEGKLEKTYLRQK